jgi:hypothetical protein
MIQTTLVAQRSARSTFTFAFTFTSVFLSLQRYTIVLSRAAVETETLCITFINDPIVTSSLGTIEWFCIARVDGVRRGYHYRMCMGMGMMGMGIALRMMEAQPHTQYVRLPRV